MQKKNYTPDFKAKVVIELLTENKTLKNELKNLENINKTSKELYESKYETLKELNQQHHKSMKELSKQQDKTIENINTKHQEQLKQIYDKFNEDLTKYITVNQLQNTALKRILELGFIDLIMNKHKKIAKDQIKELATDKKVYELTLKK